MLPAAPFGLPTLAVKALVAHDCRPGIVVDVEVVVEVLEVLDGVELPAPLVGAGATVVVGAVVFDAEEPWLDELQAARNTPQAAMKPDLTTMGALRLPAAPSLIDTNFRDQSLERRLPSLLSLAAIER